MIYLKQNEQGAAEDLRRVGCFWRCGVNIAERLANTALLSVGEMNSLWQECLDEGLMLQTATGPELYKGVVPIIDKVLKYFKSPRRVAEVGTFSKGEYAYYGWYRNMGEDLCIGERFYIQKIKMDETHIEPFHYRLVEGNGAVLFDPYNPAIKADGVEYSIIIEEIL